MNAFRNRRPGVWAIAAALLAAAASNAPARIDPNFTPVHLVEQSDRIASLELHLADGQVAARLLKCLKGDAPDGAIELDVSKAGKPQADALRGAIGPDRKVLALLFVGTYREEGPEGGEPDPAAGPEGMLHVRGRWFRVFQRAGQKAWLLDLLDEGLQTTWAGGTDMLARAVAYVLASSDPIVPVRTGASWAEKTLVARLEGKVRGAVAVDLDGDGAPAVHLLCDAGDRVLRWDAKKRAFADLASGLALDARSHAAAWADFNADGRLDLAWWDGALLRVRFRSATGALEPRAWSTKLPHACTGLAVLDVGVRGRAGLLVSTDAGPLLLGPDADGGFALKDLLPPIAGKGHSAGLGEGRACLVADFDGDANADVLQPFAEGMLLLAGKGRGAFAAPRRWANVRTGKGPGGAFTGDFDADGLPDVFVAADERCFLWQNAGGGRFVEALELAGEAAYISKAGGIGGGTCDVNNDGRQDVMVLYADRPPQLFFNRGFRSFGHSHELDLDERQLLPAAAAGQQAGLAADLDGDGGQDMLLVLTDGSVWVFFRDTADVPALCVRALLPAAGGFAGPLTVVGWTPDRNLGAWSVTAGGAGAFFGLPEPGTLKLRWRLPGRAVREQQVPLKAKPVVLPLTP